MNATLHRGKLAKPPKVLSVRPLTREDLGVLREKRVGAPRIKQLRAQHHRLAYMLASGMTIREVAEVTGYSTTRLLQLRDNDPAFRDLMAKSEPDAKAAARLAVDEYARARFEQATMANEIILEHLNRCVERMDDPEAELIPLKSLLPITQDFADRYGHGKHSTQVNKVVDFAKMMEQAQNYRGMGTVIDAVPRTPPGTVPAEAVTPPSSTQPPQDQLAVGTGIRRRL